MLAELKERVRAVAQRHALAQDRQALRRLVTAGATDAARFATGWAPLDAELGGGLPLAGLHEWIGCTTQTEGGAAPAPRRCGAAAAWSPPLGVLTHLAWQRLAGSVSPTAVAWIGAATFPHPPLLTRSAGRDRRLLANSLFVAASRGADRLWAADLAIRSPAIHVVVVDLSRFDLPATQRLQVLAQAHETLVLGARPPTEEREPSAAQTRWRVAWDRTAVEDSPTIQPTWTVELLRCKGVQPFGRPRCWTLEWDYVAHAVRLPAAVARAADATHVAPNSTPGRRQTA